MTAASDTILDVTHLSMRFGGIVAVGDLSFSAERGKITALIGPNGAGKTTVFNCITGFYKPTTGMIELTHADGKTFLLERLFDYRISKLAKVARTFQNIRLFAGMTLLENLLVAQHNALMRASGLTFLGLIGAPIYTAAERRAIDLARYWLERMALLDRADDAAGNLAYGDQRRLEIARAMCAEPALLCLDEPAAGLNARESAALNELLLGDPRRPRHLDPADRARHVGGDGNFRPRGGARPRREDRRRHAGARPQRSEGDRRLSRRRRRGRRDRGDGGPAMSALLQISGLRAAYGKIVALKGVDLDVNSGEIVALIGSNGAGKSTLMMSVFGKPRAQAGRIIFDGQDITHVPTHEIARLRIAQSPEGRRIFPRMSVMENLQMGADAAGDDGADRQADLRRVLSLFPILEERLIAARRHAVGRRAADAGDRPRADEPAAPADAGRAVARPRAADNTTDF